ncbi:hypothetical protein NKH77_00830 [Streptomyces sp. M19]
MECRPARQCTSVSSSTPIRVRKARWAASSHWSRPSPARAAAPPAPAGTGTRTAVCPAPVRAVDSVPTRSAGTSPARRRRQYAS